MFECRSVGKACSMFSELKMLVRNKWISLYFLHFLDMASLSDQLHVDETFRRRVPLQLEKKKNVYCNIKLTGVETCSFHHCALEPVPLWCSRSLGAQNGWVWQKKDCSLLLVYMEMILKFFAGKRFQAWYFWRRVSCEIRSHNGTQRKSTTMITEILWCTFLEFNTERVSRQIRKQTNKQTKTFTILH